MSEYMATISTTSIITILAGILVLFPRKITFSDRLKKHKPTLIHFIRIMLIAQIALLPGITLSTYLLCIGIGVPIIYYSEYYRQTVMKKEPDKLLNIILPEFRTACIPLAVITVLGIVAKVLNL